MLTTTQQLPSLFAARFLGIVTILIGAYSAQIRPVADQPGLLALLLSGGRSCAILMMDRRFESSAEAAEFYLTRLLWMVHQLCTPREGQAA